MVQSLNLLIFFKFLSFFSQFDIFCNLNVVVYTFEVNFSMKEGFENEKNFAYYFNNKKVQDLPPKAKNLIYVNEC